MKKTGISLAIALMLIMSFTILPVYGITEEQLKHGPDLLSPARVAEIQELKEQITEKNMSTPMGVGGRKYLSVTNQKQINIYYCGPATTAQVLNFFGVSKTQAALGSEMGTVLSSVGTYVYRIRNALNKYLGSGTYKYVLTSEIRFGNGLEHSILKNKPVICHTNTGTLPVYKAASKSSLHYVVATGYYYYAQGSSGGSTVRYNDPNNDSRFYGTFDCSWSEMESAINNNQGFYIMGA